MDDRSDVYASLDLALRIGDVMLSSGAGAADVSATMVAVTAACGVRYVHADVTFVDLTLRHQPSAQEPAALQVRRLSRRQVDYTALTEVDQTCNDLVAGLIGREEARAQLARTVSAGNRRRRWAVTVGWGAMGAGIALTLDSDPLVCVLAFLAACAIHATQRLMAPLRMPTFYVQMAGGLVATLVAIAAAAVDADLDPSRVVTAGIVMLLAGIGLMGGTQDALSGFPVTASARLLDATLDTAGIIAGVSAGLSLGTVLGVGPGTITPGASGLAEGTIAVVGAAIAASAFAFASYGPARSLAAVAILGSLAQAVQLAVASTPFGRTWASAAAAVTVGCVCYLVAGRFRVPPLVVVVPAIVPLLPGLVIYRGLAELAAGQDGVQELVTAAATALALAAGVILGQYIAYPLRREAHRLETRLAGPHMSGPFSS